jgi:hypothetical protein
MAAPMASPSVLTSLTSQAPSSRTLKFGIQLELGKDISYLLFQPEIQIGIPLPSFKSHLLIDSQVSGESRQDPLPVKGRMAQFPQACFSPRMHCRSEQAFFNPTDINVSPSRFTLLEPSKLLITRYNCRYFL